MLKKLLLHPFPPLPLSKGPETFFSLLVFKWKTHVQKHVSRCNVNETLYRDAFSGRLRQMNILPLGVYGLSVARGGSSGG